MTRLDPENTRVEVDTTHYTGHILGPKQDMSVS